MKRVRILVADDHEVVRRGLRSLLEAQPGWEVVAEAVNGRQAVVEALARQPDIVILDIAMPELNGLEAARQIVKALPRAEVLVHTMHYSEQMAHEVLAAGARAYVLKSDGGQDLLAAIQSLLLHKIYLTSSVSEVVVGGYLRSTAAVAAPPSADRLTAREREIIQLLAEGKANKDVANTLGISLRTAENHRANIMHKLNLKSLSDLIHYTLRNGIVAPPTIDTIPERSKVPIEPCKRLLGEA